MVAAGTAGEDRGVVGFGGKAFGLRLSSYHGRPAERGKRHWD
jgi:hypothetical protein